jgi:hypothetical protein
MKKLHKPMTKEDQEKTLFVMENRDLLLRTSSEHFTPNDVFEVMESIVDFITEKYGAKCEVGKICLGLVAASDFFMAGAVKEITFIPDSMMPKKVQ